jgi:hypothetical protein
MKHYIYFDKEHWYADGLGWNVFRFDELLGLRFKYLSEAFDWCRENGYEYKVCLPEEIAVLFHCFDLKKSSWAHIARELSEWADSSETSPAV